MPSQTIAVFGATGTQGRPVVDAARRAGQPVVALTRDPLAAADKLPGDVDIREADLLVPDSLQPALEGADAVFFHVPVLPEPERAGEITARVLAAAHSAGARRLVFTTGAFCGDIMPAGPFVDGLRRLVEMVRSADLETVVLRPTLYLANLVWPHLIQEMRSTGLLAYPPLDPERRVSWTATEDQGRIALSCMHADLAGEVLDIASPEAVTGAELAQMLAGVFGREIHYAPRSVDEFVAELAGLSGDAGFATAVGTVYEGMNRLPADGLVVDSASLEQRLGLELTPVSRWVEAHYGRLLALYGA